MEPPDFDRWGAQIEGEDKRRGRARSRSLADLSLVRVATLAVIVAALVALIVHFAGGGRSSNPTAGPTPNAAVAAAINVKLADLGGFHVGSSAGVTVGGDPSTALRQCFGSSLSPADTAVPSFQSADFVSGTGLHFVSLDSAVSFAPATVLASEASLAANARFAPCLANSLAALTYRAHGLAITSGGGAQATPLSLPPARSPGVHTMIGARATMTWSVNGLNFPVFVDLYVATLGHDQLRLFVLSSQQPYSLATEDRLVGLLESRAQQHPH